MDRQYFRQQWQEEAYAKHDKSFIQYIAHSAITSTAIGIYVCQICYLSIIHTTSFYSEYFKGHAALQ